MVRATSRRRPFSGIRPIDPLRDARDVVRLIEEGFGKELNPMAQETLRDLHWLSRMAWLLGPFLGMTPFEGLSSGFVWAEGRHIVGNVTVSQCRRGEPGCWLVSNLVVDPARRGRGVGRSLMRKALAHMFSQNGRRAILQVRGDNRAAVHLYREMGFVAVDTLLEMRLPETRPMRPVTSRNEGSQGRRFGRRPPVELPLRWRGYDEWHHEYLLSREALPAAAQRMRPLQASSFRVEWDERLLRWSRNWCGSVQEYRLAIGEKGRLEAALTVWAGRRRPYHRLAIIVRPEYRGQWEGRLVDQALTLLHPYPRHPVCVEAYAAHQALVRALESRGFVTDRELVQMELDLTEKG